MFYDATALRGHEDTPLTFRAIVNDLSGHLASDEVVDLHVEFPAPGGPATPYALIHYQRPGADYGDHTTGNFNDFWGLHLWGNAIDAAEATDWTSPKPFLGEDDYGRFAFVKLADDTQAVNFIVHRGDTKDPDNSPDRGFVPATTPEIWLKQGDVNIYTSQAAAQGHATVHYACAPDCTGVTIDATSQGSPVSTNAPPDATDDYGAVFRLSPSDLSQPLTVTISDGGVADVSGQAFTPTATPTVWFQVGDQTVYPSRGAAGTCDHPLPAAGGRLREPGQLGLQRLLGPPRLGGRRPATGVDHRRLGQDVFGVTFRVPLVDGASQLAYILHRGDTKDPGPDQFLVFDDYGHEVWHSRAPILSARTSRRSVAEGASAGYRWRA